MDVISFVCMGFVYCVGVVASSQPSPVPFQRKQQRLGRQRARGENGSSCLAYCMTTPMYSPGSRIGGGGLIGMSIWDGGVHVFFFFFFDC